MSMHLPIVYKAGWGQGTVTGSASSGSITIGGPGEQQVTKANVGGSATITIGGGPGSYQDCQITSYDTYGSVMVPVYTCTTYYYGGVGVAIHGFSVAGSGSSAVATAASLAAALNVTSSPVTATANGAVVTMTAKTPGASSNYPFTLSPSGGFTAVSPTTALAGGSLAGTYFDSGTITATLSGTPVKISFGSGSTQSSVAASLGAAINSTAGGFVTAAVSGTTINLTSNGGGIFTDWGVTSAVTYDTADFSAPSFTATTANMSGGTSSTGSVVYGFDIPDLLGYAPNGNLLIVNDIVMGQWNYGYDNLNRLKSATNSNGPYPDQNSSWTYDAFGNRTSEINPVANTSATFTSATNQVTATSGTAVFLYDAAGDIVYDGLNNYIYDAEGRVCAMRNSVGTTVGYIYDAAGVRVSKVNLNQFSCNLAYGYTPTSSYVLGLGGEQITEFNVYSGVSTWAHTNVFNGGGLLATYSPTGNTTGSMLSGSSVRTSTYFALNDWLGTKRAEVGANGCVSTYLSMPFGGGLTANGNCTDPTEHHFTGKEHDNETGNDYFAARYYNSTLGHFMSPDTLEPVKASKKVFTQVLMYPQDWNKYSYALNNPVVYKDDTGHFTGRDHSEMETQALQQMGYSQQSANRAARADVAMDNPHNMASGVPFLHWFVATSENPQHGERSDSSTVEVAKASAEQFISEKIFAAFGKANAGAFDQALDLLGQASHTAQDIVRHGYEKAGDHTLGEAAATPAEMSKAIAATKDVMARFETMVRSNYSADKANEILGAC